MTPDIIVTEPWNVVPDVVATIESSIANVMFPPGVVNTNPVPGDNTLAFGRDPVALTNTYEALNSGAGPPLLIVIFPVPPETTVIFGPASIYDNPEASFVKEPVNEPVIPDIPVTEPWNTVPDTVATTELFMSSVIFPVPPVTTVRAFVVGFASMYDNPEANFVKEPVRPNGLFTITAPWNVEPDVVATTELLIAKVAVDPAPPSVNEIPVPAVRTRLFGREPVVPMRTYEALIGATAPPCPPLPLIFAGTHA